MTLPIHGRTRQVQSVSQRYIRDVTAISRLAGIR